MGKKGKGGLCHYIAKKHHKSAAWEAKCRKKASRKHRRKKSRRRSVRYNPWAVCHSQGLRKGTRKFESCVQDVKASNRNA